MTLVAMSGRPGEAQRLTQVTQFADAVLNLLLGLTSTAVLNGRTKTLG